MKGDKLIELLHSLHPTQREELKKFVKLKLSDDDERVTLLSYLINSFNNKKKWNPTIATIDTGIKSLSRRLNQLLEITKDYFLYYYADKLGFYKEYTLADIFFEKNCKKNYHSQVTKMKKATDCSKEKISYTSYNQYYDFLRKEQEIIYHKIEEPNMESISMLEKYLDAFYIENKLRLLCELESRKIFVGTKNTKKEFKLLKAFLENINSSKWIDNPVVEIYYHVFLMLKNKSTQYYTQCEKWLEKKDTKSKFNVDFIKTICEYLMNFCIYKVNQNDDTYAGKYLVCINFLIKNAMLLEPNGSISLFRYQNVIKMGARSNDKKFLVFSRNFARQRYQSLNMSENRQKAIYDYSLAYLYFWEGNYKKAAEKRPVINEDDDFYYYILNHVLFLQLCYEQKYLKRLIESVKEFRIEINRKQLMRPIFKQAVLLFCEYLLGVLSVTEHQDLEEVKSAFYVDLEAGVLLESRWFKKIIEDFSLY